LGPPGVGKGTYASLIGPILGIPQISTGDLVRKEIKDSSSLGIEIKELVGKGGLVPDEMVTEMLKNRLQEEDAQKGFILDGFPRTLKQAELLENITDIDVVLNIRLQENIIIRKISARRVCKQCGNIYNIADIREGEIHMPPILPKKEGVCDKCGGELHQREDDKEAVVQERLDVYKKQTQPLIDYYREKGTLKDIDVLGPPEMMVDRFLELLKEK